MLRLHQRPTSPSIYSATWSAWSLWLKEPNNSFQLKTQKVYSNSLLNMPGMYCSPKPGTSLTPRDIKFIPRKDFFENMMGKIIGAKSTTSVLSFFRQWGNRIWFQIFGTPIRPAHACLFLCLSVCAFLAVYYLSTGQVEKNKFVSSSDVPQNQRISEYVKKILQNFCKVSILDGDRRTPYLDQRVTIKYLWRCLHRD